MNKYRDIMGRVNYALFLAVVALLPFPQIFLRYACVAWVISWFLELRWLSRPKSLKANKMAIPFMLFGVWYAWRILSGLWAADHAAWAFQMECYMTFGLLVPVGLWGVNERYNLRQIGKVLVGSCLIAVFFYPAFLTLLLYHREIIDNHPCLHAMWDYSSSEWLYFYQTNISHLKHRLFLCSVELFAIYIAFVLYRQYLKKLLPILLLILAFIIFSGSRQILITTVAVIIVEALFALPVHYRKRYAAGVVLIGLMLGAGILSLHPRMRDIRTASATQIQHYETDDFVRLNIWQVALQNPKDYALRGLGGGQSTPYLIERYNALGLDTYAAKRYNCHNQYLEELMELGVGGLLFFLLMWLIIPFCARGEGRQTACVFVVLFLCNMFTDCMFGRFCGIALWAVAIVFIFAQSQPQNSVSDREGCTD